MEYTYMGIFSSIFNWVLDKILSPVFTFVGNLLSTVLSWIFNNVLGPLLETVLWPLLKQAWNLVVSILAGVLYGVYAKVLSFVDYMNSGFDYMIGLKEIKYGEKNTTLLKLLVIDMPETSKVFWTINFIGLALALIFTIYSVTKSTLDFDFENKRPVSKVLSSFFKCFVQLLTVQFFVYFVVKLSDVILSVINQAMSQLSAASSGSIGSIIFCVSSLNAAKDSKYNLATAAGKNTIGITDAVRKNFYTGAAGYSYTDSGTVEKYFNLAKFDYVIGFALALFMLVIMAICLIVFVQRLFDVMLLYLVSPYFVAMMPLDDGQRFGKWREMFIGKVFSGFGMVMAMKLYLMLCPTIMSGSVVFDSSTEMDYAAKMIFLIGGAWATLKSGTIVTSLISDEAGGQETETSRVISMAAGGLAAAGGRTALRGVGAGARALGNQFRGARQRSQQKFEDTKFQPDGGGMAEGGTSIPGISMTGADTTPDTSATPENAAGTPATPENAAEMPSTPKPPATPDTSSEPELSSTLEATTALTEESASLAEQSGTDVEESLQSQDTAAQGYFENPDKGKKIALYPLGFNQYKMKDGSIKTGINLGGFVLGIKADGAGKKLSLLGFRIRIGTDGSVKSFSLPCNIFKMKRGNDGKLHTAKVNLFVAKWSANTDTGKIQFTDSSIIGLHRKFDKNGEGHITNILGAKRELQENNEYRLTSLPGGIFQRSYTRNEDGSLSTAGVRVLGMNLMTDETVVEHNRERRGANAGQNDKK